MKEAILYKEDFLYAHKELFAQIVWVNRRAKCTVYSEKDGVSKISVDRNMDFLDVPSSCLHHAKPIVDFTK